MKDSVERNLVLLLLITVPALAYSLSIRGCERQTKEITISGVVCTAEGITDSYVLSFDYEDKDYERLSGATVSLFSDERAENPIAGGRSITDLNGRYKLRITRASLPTDRDERCYLVFAKPGYKTFVLEVVFGPLYGYRRNTIVLKRLMQGERKGSEKSEKGAKRGSAGHALRF